MRSATLTPTNAPKPVKAAQALIEEARRRHRRRRRWIAVVVLVTAGIGLAITELGGKHRSDTPAPDGQATVVGHQGTNLRSAACQSQLQDSQRPTMPTPT